jgi:hypothetical protein
MRPSVPAILRSNRAVRVISSIVASVVLASTDARAGDDRVPCVTHTARDPGAILVPLGDDPGSPVGVSIVAGEILCLVGPVTRGVLAPALADQDGHTTIVELRLDSSASATTLFVRSASDRVMTYLPAVVAGPANIALPTSGLRVEAHGTAVQSFSPAVHGVLLRQVRFIAPPPRMELVPLEERWGQVSVQGLVGVRRLSVSAFDAPLRASGYAALPREYVGGGLLLDFALARWRFGLRIAYEAASAPSLVDSGSVGASVGDVSLELGYDLLRWEGLTLFAQAGVGLSALMLDTHDPHLTNVARRTQVGSDVSTVEQDSLLLGAQLGLEQLVPLGRASAAERYALVLSLRGGYEQQFANLGWETSNGDSRSLGGLPLVDLGGAWGSLGIGFGVYSSSWRSVSPAVP